MPYKYNIIPFGREKDRVDFVHIHKPKKNGFAGMVRSRLFKENLAVFVKDYDEIYSARICLGENNVLVISMILEIFYGIKRGNKAARMTLFHELGQLCKR